MDKKMSLVDHLSDLRKALISMTIALAFGSIIGYLNIQSLLDYLKRPLPIEKLVFFSPVEAFLVNIKIALLSGVIIAFPVIVTAIAWFMAPGLTKKEKKIITLLAFLSTLLFLCGAAVAYLGALPLTLKFLFDFTPENIIPYVSISYYISFIINFIVVFGLSFQYPFVIFVLIISGIIKQDFFKSQRKYVVLSIVSLSLVLAPGTDIITQFLMFGPLYILFEIAVLMGGFVKNRKVQASDLN